MKRNTSDLRVEAHKGYSARSAPPNDRATTLTALGGASLAFLGLAAIAVTWVITFLRTTEALNTASLEFRKAKAQVLSEQVANIIRPLWGISRQLVDRVKVGGSQDGKVVFPPNVDLARPSHQAAYNKGLAPYVNWELYMRSTNEDLTENTHNNIIGSASIIALDSNNMVTFDPSACTGTVIATLNLDAETQENYFNIFRFFDNTTEPGMIERHANVFDRLTFQSGPVAKSVVAADCSYMWPLWAGTQLRDFYDFTWFGPYDGNIGWGNQLIGSIPVYNEQGLAIGGVGTFVSLGLSIAPILEEFLEDSLVKLSSAAAIYTEGGFVIGLSEAAASSGSDQAKTLEDLVAGSITAEAIKEVKSRLGVPCPSRQEFLDLDDTLIDVTNFVAEDYGLPPLPERWCLLLALPRRNIFEAIDDAKDSAQIVGVACGGGFLVAVVLLLVALFLTISMQRRMRLDKRKHDLTQVEEAAAGITRLTSPMVVISAEDFLTFDKVRLHEEVRDAGQAKYLDSIDAVSAFKALGNLIVFISHQWLSQSHPDNDDHTQLHVMQEAVEYFVSASPDKKIYVWLDYISIAQRHPRVQAAAVAALPVFVSLVDRFVICAPDATHVDTHRLCNLASYDQRGWCRAEMLAKACSSGIKDMWVCAGNGHMRPFTTEDMDRISLNVYEGHFTVAKDAEKLVQPILGLYSLILRQREKENMRQIRDFIEARKESFFPHSYKLDEHGEVEERQLFGELTNVMEDFVRQHSGSTCPETPQPEQS